MTVLALVALVAGGMALLRYLVGLGLVLRFVRRARIRAIPKGATPPLTLLKPLYGGDPGLDENLLATLRQNYPEFEVLFLHERPDDPAVAVAEAAAREVPDVPVRFLSGRDPAAANPKVAVLVRGEAEARHDLLVAADADVRPDPLYLRDVANGLAEADLVSFAPVVFGMRTFWARLLGLLFDSEFFLGVVMAGGQASTGATIGVRRDALERAGGFRAVQDRIADDYDLGVAVRRAGGSLTLARRAARIYMPGGDFSATASFVARWARVIRTAAPGYFAFGVALAFTPLLLMVAAILTPFTAAALWLLVLNTAMRTMIALVVDFRFCWDRSVLASLHLMPLLWFVEPAAICVGLAGRTVTWRGRRYRLKGGRATLVDA